MAKPPPARFSYATPDLPVAKRLLIALVEQAGGRRRLKRLYDRAAARPWGPGETFFDRALAALGVELRVAGCALARVPATGPVLVIANHPYGVLDGLALTALALRARSDVLVMAHAALTRIPEAHGHLLPVDFAGTPAAQTSMLASRKAARDWLSRGGAVGIFPGGGVATSPRAFSGRAEERPWHPFTAKLILSARASVVPVHFAGQNSRLFQAASHLSQTLRLSLLFRETARRIDTPLDVRVGAPIPFEALAGFANRAALLAHLRQVTLTLGRAPG
ncbi:hypothetical protein CCR85_09340 [Rhodothalassium salexigens]|uniref:1-acyl-sn-glycerol-3-phosphate acyltransferase n=1 Tax=Rhodothalassium salexigens TaxID=1086 RepID=UPI00191329AD|nr:hypothetical protein [Rhodothalassium salexigens]MBK5919722.1 hypothetical protein [Rhodothalassium salexigens]